MWEDTRAVIEREMDEGERLLSCGQFFGPCPEMIHDARAVYGKVREAQNTAATGPNAP